MDLNTVTSIVPAHARSDLARLGPTVAALAGGSVLFAEPNPSLTGLIDLTGFGWPSLTATDEGLTIGATCTLAELATFPPVAGWHAHPLFYQCCTALFGSFKVWNVATVGGNICTSLPAGPMTSLAAGLDATALIWCADGTDLSIPVADFVTGNMANVLADGDVLRSIQIPITSLRARTAYRKIALSALGRSGAVLVGRTDPDGRFVLTVTAATVRPAQLRFDRVPEAAALADAIQTIDSFFTDAHGAADWRRAMSVVLGEEIRAELAGSTAESTLT